MTTTDPKPAIEWARGRLVGDQLPPLDASVVPIRTGDMLVLVTEGIRSNFGRSTVAKSPPQRGADDILQHYYKGTDGAPVLVARYFCNTPS